MTYANRREAGDALGRWLAAYQRRPDVLVLGLVRGGVPVAVQVAGALGVPWDVLVVRKLGVPWAPEVAFGALGPGGVVVHNAETEARIAPAEVSDVVRAEARELSRREATYRGDRPPLSLAGLVTIVVDDGLATGATARVAVAVARHLGAVRAVVAVPVGPPEAVALVGLDADEVVCPLQPRPFGAVSMYYDSFPQTTDAEVIALLRGTLGH